jgi:hypothetical protein
MSSNSFGPQHDFRASFVERAKEALEYFRAEFPDADVWLDNPPMVTKPLHQSPAYSLVVEGIEVVEKSDCPERFRSVADGLHKIVAEPRGMDVFKRGGEVYFSA